MRTVAALFCVLLFAAACGGPPATSDPSTDDTKADHKISCSATAFSGDILDHNGYPIGRIVVKVKGDKDPMDAWLKTTDDGHFLFNTQACSQTAAVTAYINDNTTATVTVDVDSPERLVLEQDAQGTWVLRIVGSSS
jgi:hypothetical protein